MTSTDKKQQPQSGTTVEPGGIDRLSEAFESSARRWELIIYPSMFAFVVLAAYGFFLIYRLAGDVHYLAISVDSHMSVLSNNMQNMSENMGQITTNIRTMTVSLDSIEHQVSTLRPILASMESMDQSIKMMNVSTRDMTNTTRYMQYDMHRLNRNIGKPMSIMNSSIPW
ncbi:MAG TPA: hypothetical protein ENJ98_04965 [Thiolapillus brandeum]|uniref:DUF948 domain-containing protein n=1 Tax=Thiolapillus brandeum TaxID=1076588 RepID=A0A7C5N8C7_9GAMM|nr:hypothetical protein [Thiolapillus brandeum]